MDRAYAGRIKGFDRRFRNVQMECSQKVYKRGQTGVGEGSERVFLSGFREDSERFQKWFIKGSHEVHTGLQRIYKGSSEGSDTVYRKGSSRV